MGGTQFFSLSLYFCEKDYTASLGVVTALKRIVYIWPRLDELMSFCMRGKRNGDGVDRVMYAIVSFRIVGRECIAYEN